MAGISRSSRLLLLLLLLLIHHRRQSRVVSCFLSRVPQAGDRVVEELLHPRRRRVVAGFIRMEDEGQPLVCGPDRCLIGIPADLQELVVVRRRIVHTAGSLLTGLFFLKYHVLYGASQTLAVGQDAAG